MDDVLAWAHRYIAMGWRVLPIKPGTKRPPMNEWQNAATDDPNVIENWWNGLYRGHGIGIATGQRSGLWVLDVDPQHGGDQSLQPLIDQYGPLPSTLTVRTGSGGRHYYFLNPQGVEVVTSRDRLGMGLDVRGEGGQVVAPPTRHQTTGQPYVWELSPWTLLPPV